MEFLKQLYSISLVISVICSIAMAALLRLKSARKEIVNPLVLFCIGVATWISGYLLINSGAPFLMEAGRFLINLSPLVATFFLHFVLLFINTEKKALLPAIYSIAFVTTGAGLFMSAGEVSSWSVFDNYYIANKATALLAVVTLIFSTVAHLLLLRASLHSNKKRQRQMIALFLSGLLGLLSCSGFVFEAMGINSFPYPVLLLPGYTLLMTYGILRYELMEINIWARRTLTWALIIFVPLLVVSIPLALIVRYGTTGFSGMIPVKCRLCNP